MHPGTPLSLSLALSLSHTHPLPLTHRPPPTAFHSFAAVPRNMTGIATKMKAAGYATHMAGKWDAGMATQDHTPQGRGYDTSLNYFHHAKYV